MKAAEYTINISWRLLATTEFSSSLRKKLVRHFTGHFKLHGKLIIS